MTQYQNVLLCSGGLDSAVMAAQLAGSELLHVFVDYGQRNLPNEAHAAKRIARYYGAERRYVDLHMWGAMASSSLTRATGELIGEDTVVPGRNAVLLAVATSLCAPGGTVFIGANATDYALYLDCRPGFIDAFGEVAATYGVTIKAPLLHLTKPQIGELAHAVDVPLEMTWSCYAGGAEPCTECGACLGRAEAFGCFR